MICGGGALVEGIGGESGITRNSDHTAHERRIGDRQSRSHALVIGIRIAGQPADRDLLVALATGDDVDKRPAPRIAGTTVAGQGFDIDLAGGDIAGTGQEPDARQGIGISQRVDAGNRNGVGRHIAGDRHALPRDRSAGKCRSPADAIAAGVGL